MHRETHSRPVPGGRGHWWSDRLWALAADLEPFPLAPEDVPEWEQDCWFDREHPPTLRAVAEHLRRVEAADLSHPVVLSADGRLMDGGHRLVKAHLSGLPLSAVRFTVDPEPDRVVPDPEPLDRGCVFCCIVAGTLPSEQVYVDVDVVAFLDAAPATDGHTLVVPRRHARDLLALEPEEAAALGRATRAVAALLRDRFAPLGLTVVQSNGRAAGQEVDHVHTHVVPRYADDGLVPPWGEVSAPC